MSSDEEFQQNLDTAQGVVSESSGLKERIREVVAEAHRAGLFLFTYGELNNDIPYYLAQKAAGVDAVIMDDVGRLTKVDTARAPCPQYEMQTLRVRNVCMDVQL